LHKNADKLTRKKTFRDVHKDLIIIPWLNLTLTGQQPVCGAVAEMVAERKLAKYSNLASNFIFQPIAVENLGAFSLSTLEFLSDVSHKLSSFSGEERASSFLFQSVGVAASF